ncbi:uncharacterized protein LOC9305614 [Arabidopsis lyrata subsp. lyrata]|uniref:uncharacterized protein LOC9305614 n=1 Tax=Arabidopsis lyrata subsp. lyrata TaxID=81972 RepID=UPI000A29E24D|nr:uncharacterized protein LOC9305614 [Arabidopsis lyrata subsp. lyrata]|eukprot:XP_020874224.1 uncharacterized protein LOC9305614 [Arabidopsis lyrata subsp. lyrata]
MFAKAKWLPSWDIANKCDYPQRRERETREKEMYLKRPIWSDGASAATPENPSESENGEDSDAAAMVVEELVTSLNTQRLYRELTLSLRTGLRDACAEFSFLRICGLRSLLKTLRTVADSDSIIRLFSHTQTISDLQLVPVLFRHSLKEAEDDRVTSLDHIFSVEPMKITSPSTDAEVAVALRVLEGCCLLHPQSTVLAHKHGAVRVMMNVLSTRGVLEQGACLDALISVLLDSSANQVDFGACNGIEEVAMLMRDKQADENLRLRCGEFLLLLVGHVNGKDRSPIASVNEDIRRLLGEKSASLIWAASQFGSTGDPEQRITALHIQAGRVLESLDLY